MSNPEIYTEDDTAKRLVSGLSFLSSEKNDGFRTKRINAYGLRCDNVYIQGPDINPADKPTVWGIEYTAVFTYDPKGQPLEASGTLAYPGKGFFLNFSLDAETGAMDPAEVAKWDKPTRLRAKDLMDRLINVVLDAAASEDGGEK